MIILGPAEVNSRGGTCFGAGSSSVSSSDSPSSTTVATFFFVVRDRVALVVGLGAAALALVIRVLVRADALEGRFFGGGLTRADSPWTSAGRVPGGLPRRLGAI